MHRLKVFAGAVLALALLASGPAFAQGADFTHYIALGDSLTAGFCSGSIVQTCQSKSYPAILNQQFTGRTTGFEQPLVSTPGLPGVLTLQSLLPTPRIVPTPGLGQPVNLIGRSYDNLAVPGADVHDLLTKVQSTSPTDPTNLVLMGRGTQVQQAIGLRPTFITFWIGNNDALAAATSGIVNDQTLTPLASFEADYRAAVTALATGTSAKMALANIPNVTSIPFVTTLTRFVPNPATGQPAIVNGTTVPLIGPNGPLQAGDFVLLTASAELAVGRGIPAALGGSGVPLSDSAVLSASEAATIRARVDAYNNVIRAVANERGAALVDANAELTNLAVRGVTVGGVTYTSAFLTGGVFSYDGVHPSAFGYAFVANLFIAAINEKFGTDVEPANLFPFMFGFSTTSTASLTGNAIFDPSKVGPPYVFTADARRNLLLTLGVPKWIVDGTPAPRPRRPGRGNRG